MSYKEHLTLLRTHFPTHAAKTSSAVLHSLLYWLFLLAWRPCIPSLPSLGIFRVQESPGQSHSENPDCTGGVGVRVGGGEKGKPDGKQCYWEGRAPRTEVQQTQNELFPRNNIQNDCIRFKCAFVASTWFPYENVLRSKPPVYNWILRS